DRAMLSTILDAIVQNALEAISFEKNLGLGRLNADSDQNYTEGRVILCVSTRVKNGNLCVQFVVEDNGPGLSVDFPELVYSPFYSGRLAGRGLGMGLSKAWRLAEQIGAQIHFEQSAVFAKGCRWSVELPAF
ncbi:MAG: ATP-binding protein, partial [Thermoguttaceae bacterium]